MTKGLRKLTLWFGIRVVPAVLATFVFSVTGLTADVTDYQTRVESASKNIANLRSRDERSTIDASIEESLIRETRLLIPGSEKIDLPGTTVETDNGWLHEGLTSLAEETDPERKAAILLSLEERLFATAEQLRQLDISTTANSKDETKRKIAEILRRPEFQPPQAATESLFQRWIREFTEWLARVFPRAPILPDTPSGAGTLRNGLMILLFALVIGIIGYLMYRFVPMIAHGRKGEREKRREEKVVLGERISDEKSGRDLFNEAELLAQQGNLRGAIRKGYISLLCDLSDRKLLRLSRHKTNRDYLKDVRGHSFLFEKMAGLTHSFERNWYGLRTVEPSDWEEFRFNYEEALRNAKV
jgi:hypothetical protein